MKKLLLQTNRAETVDEKMGSFVKNSCFLLKYGSLNAKVSNCFSNTVRTGITRPTSNAKQYSHGIIKNNIFWKSIMRTVRCVKITIKNLDFLLISPQICNNKKFNN